jgi:hypothetical protein
MGANGERISRDTVTEDGIGARRLWTAVVVVAVNDWRNGTLRARRKAQEFLFENDKDFEMVCAGAGLEPGDFRTRLLKIGQRIEMQNRNAQPLAA